MIIDIKKENKTIIIWDSIPEANGYMVYKKTQEHLYHFIKEVTSNKISLYNISDGDEIKIKPYKKNKDKREFLFDNFKITLGQNNISETITPVMFINKSSAYIAWTPVKSANKYFISGSSGLSMHTNINECTLKNLPYGTSNIRIEAYENDKLLCRSDEYLINIKRLEIFGINTDNKILLFWNKVPDVDGYRIFKKNERNEFAGFQSSTETNAIVSNFEPNELCEYKVKPYTLEEGKRVYSGLSAKCKIKAYNTNIVDITMVEAYNNQMAISWIFDGEVDGYDIFNADGLFAEIPDGLAHIYMTEKSKSEFYIKGYKWHYGEKLYTCASDKVKLKNCRNYKPQNYKISVIIPAYNSQDYISRTICSVLASTIDDVEIILIDDGSKDDTKKIITWYCKKYPNFVKGIFKENSGVADTRNYGIKVANGKYIAFMDNDDIIRPEGFEKLYKNIVYTNADIAVSPIYLINNDKYHIRHTLPFTEKIAYNVEDYLKLIFSDGYNNIGVWNKLYRTELVKKHPYSLLSYEDVSWTPYIISYADKFCYVKDIAYEWDRRIRPTTFSTILSNRTAEEKFKERLAAFTFFYKQGNQVHKECLAYIMAKRLYEQGKNAQYEKYFDEIRELKPELVNNKYLIEDKYYFDKISPLLI